MSFLFASFAQLMFLLSLGHKEGSLVSLSSTGTGLLFGLLVGISNLALFYFCISVLQLQVWFFEIAIKARILAVPSRSFEQPSHSRVYSIIRLLYVLYILSPIAFEEYAQYLKIKHLEWTERGYSRVRIAVLMYYTLIQWLLTEWGVIAPLP